jgi:hypothetical protein
LSISFLFFENWQKSRSMNFSIDLDFQGGLAD